MCCPAEADSGFLCNIKKIFTGMKRCQSPCKDKVYTYSMSQLKCIEKEICILEDETYCHESTIRDAMCSDCVTDCEYLRCALNSIMDKLECIRCDLQCAHECYDPVRDRCENELICQLMDRTRCLEMLVTDLCQQVCLLECNGNGWSITGNCGRRCKPGCRSPCFTSIRGACEPCIPGACGPCGPSSCGPSGPSYCGPSGPSSCGPCGPSSCGPPSCGPCGPSSCGPCGPSSYSPCGPSPCGPCGPSRPCGPCGPAYPRPTCDVECRKPRASRCKPGCRKPCCYRPTCLPGCAKPCCNPTPAIYRSGRYCERC